MCILASYRLIDLDKEVITKRALSRSHIAPTEVPNLDSTMGNWLASHWLSVLFLVSAISFPINWEF